MVVRYQTREEAQEAIAAIPSKTVWLTKYALTDGITIAHNAREYYHYKWDEDEKCFFLTSFDMVTVKGTSYHGLGKDWHTSEESALARVEVLLAAKRKTLQKQMDKLLKLTPSTIKRHEVTVGE
jgi:hypothetical protein